jgi:hypothetical protein
MKSFVLTSLVAACALAAAPAFASSLTPANATGIHAIGSTSLTQGTTTVPCTSDFTIDVAGGAGTVTNAVFSAPAAACPFIHASGLPWTITITGSTTATINNVVVVPPAPLAACGPGPVPITLFNNVVTFNTTLGRCSISGSLPITPNPPGLQIVWP